MSIPRAITGVSKPESAMSHVSQPPATLTVPADAPTASASALQFLEKISRHDIKTTFFEDELVTYADWGAELGFYRASVGPGCYRGNECIVVRARSEGRVEEVPCSTEVTGYLDWQLRTVHQELLELVQLSPGALDRRTVIERHGDGYRVRKEVRQGGGPPSVGERELDHGLMLGYVSEAANIALQRLLVTKGLPDYFETVSFDADTNLCQASYKDLALTPIKVGSPPDERTEKCWGIDRRLHCVRDVPVTWHSYFLRDGHLVSRAQAGSPILMRVRELPALLVLDEFLPVPSFERAALRWQDDLQLSSMFRDRQEALASASREFLRAHPELRALLADFLAALLAHKPADVLGFSRHFFASFSNRFVIGGTAPDQQHRADTTDTLTHLHTDRPGLLLSSFDES